MDIFALQNRLQDMVPFTQVCYLSQRILRIIYQRRAVNFRQKKNSSSPFKYSFIVGFHNQSIWKSLNPHSHHEINISIRGQKATHIQEEKLFIQLV